MQHSSSGFGTRRRFMLPANCRRPISLRVIRVKICCIKSLEEAALAIRYGAAALGLVSAMPSGPGVIPEEQIAILAAKIPQSIASVLLTSQQEATAIIQQQRRCGATTIQLCDCLTKGTYQDLRAALPNIRLMQVVHVLGEESIAQARDAA